MIQTGIHENQGLRWYALYTKSRHEKFVETQLSQKGIEAFTPKMTFRKKWSDRVKLIQEPLFKSYCFAKFSLHDKRKAVIQEGVVGVVHFKNQYIPVEDSVIRSLKTLTDSKIKVDFFPYLKINDTVVIKKGPLKGIEGKIVEKRNNNASLVISVDAIASSISCVVDMDCIEQV
jgi:transcription termination/antitermination protein NusG